jgi:hypothetical protein
MHDQSSIHDNSAGGGWFMARGTGGGVYNASGGTVSMHDASGIHDHSVIGGPVGDAPPTGGGLYAASGGILNGVYCAPHSYANVYGNTPDECHIEP